MTDDLILGSFAKSKTRARNRYGRFVKKKRSKVLFVDPSPAIRIMANSVVGHMQARIRAGYDRDGRPFAPWSELYRMSREAAGYGGGTPGVLTGGLVNSIMLLGRSGKGLTAVLRFGPYGVSQSPPRPGAWVFAEGKTPLQRATAVADWQAAKKRKPRSMQRNRIVWMLGHIQRAGGDRNKSVRVARGGYSWFWTRSKVPYRNTVRKLLGITPKAREGIISQLERAGIFK